MTYISDESQWYVSKGGRAQGPYPTSQIQNFLLQERLEGKDRVTRDGELWEPIDQVPQLIPEELLNLDRSPCPAHAEMVRLANESQLQKTRRKDMLIIGVFFSLVFICFYLW